MAKFTVERHFSLSFLGDEWKDCFLKFRGLNLRETREIISQKLGQKEPEQILDASLELVERQFVKGTGISEGKLVKVNKEDLGDLPSPTIERAISFLLSGAGMGKS